MVKKYQNNPHEFDAILDKARFIFNDYSFHNESCTFKDKEQNEG